MCSKSPRFWRSLALRAVVFLVCMGCITAVGALPAAHRSEAAANSADNGLRESHSPRNEHRRRTDPPRILCGSHLRDELANLCHGRGYNGNGFVRSGAKSAGAATQCCSYGCTRKDLDAYCNPRNTDAESVEHGSESSVVEVEDTATTNNQLRPNPVVQEEPQSVSVGTNTKQDPETENTLIRESPKHRYYVKINDFHHVNSPVTPRRQSSIR